MTQAKDWSADVFREMRARELRPSAPFPTAA